MLAKRIRVFTENFLNKNANINIIGISSKAPNEFTNDTSDMPPPTFSKKLII